MRRNGWLVLFFMSMTVGFFHVTLNELFAGDVIKLKVAAVSSSNNTTFKLIEWWGDELTKRSNGRVDVKFYPSESLAKAKEMLDAGSTGLADVVQIVAPYFPARLVYEGIPDLPFNSPPRPDQYLAAYNEFAKSDYLSNELNSLNLVYLFANPAGQFNIMGKKPVRNLEDLKGLKIRSVGNWSVLLKAFGATPVYTTVTEQYNAISRGVVDATIGAGNYVMYMHKVYEAAKDGYYTVEMDMGRTGTVMYMNKGTYDGLPDDIKQILGVIQKEIPRMAQEITFSDALNGKYLEVFRENGIQIIRFPRADREKMIDKQKMLTDKWITEHGKEGFKVREAAELWNQLKTEVEKKYPNGL